MARLLQKMEFLFRTSPTIVYRFLTTPDCLIRWFCDDCNLIEDTYCFEWEGSEEIAQVIEDIEDERLLLRWEDYEDEYLDFRLSRSEVTGETILEIHAFCDKSEIAEERQYWASKIEDLKRAMGSA